MKSERFMSDTLQILPLIIMASYHGDRIVSKTVHTINAETQANDQQNSRKSYSGCEHYKWFVDDNLKLYRISGPANEKLTIKEAIKLMNIVLTNWDNENSKSKASELLIELAECTIGTPELSGVLRQDIDDSFKTWTHVDYVPKLKEYLKIVNLPQVIGSTKENAYYEAFKSEYIKPGKTEMSTIVESFLIESGEIGLKIIGCWAMSHLKLTLHDSGVEYKLFHSIQSSNHMYPFQAEIYSIYGVKIPGTLPMVPYDLRRFIFRYYHEKYMCPKLYGFLLRASYHLRYDKSNGISKILKTFGFIDAVQSKLPLYELAKHASTVIDISIKDLNDGLRISETSESIERLEFFINSYLGGNENLSDFSKSTESIYWPAARFIDHRFMSVLEYKRNGDYIYMCNILCMNNRRKEEHRFPKKSLQKIATIETKNVLGVHALRFIGVLKQRAINK